MKKTEFYITFAFAMFELVIGITSLWLAWQWFGWRVAVLLVLVRWEQNMALTRLMKTEVKRILLEAL